MIAIKDMEMPKECYRCPLLDGEYGTCNIIVETKVDMTKERASNCPLVEIQEPRTGHWISKGDVYPAWRFCSNCGEPWTFDCGTPNFCPNCVAKMAER